MALSKKDFVNRVNALMSKGYSKEDATTLVNEDLIIDTGGKCDWEDEFTDEQAKVSRQARQADREVSTEKAKRTRTEDEDKRALMKMFLALLDTVDENRVIINPEREIEFLYNGRKFKITLSAPRAKKN